MVDLQKIGLTFFGLQTRDGDSYHIWFSCNLSEQEKKTGG